AAGDFQNFGGLPLSGIAAMGDVATPTLISLVRATVEGGRVRITWFTGLTPTASITLERKDPGYEWRALGSVAPDGTGSITIEDADVVPGSRYGYRLGVQLGGTSESMGETWLAVPGIAEL